MDTYVHVSRKKHVHTNTYTHTPTHSHTHKGRKSQIRWYSASYRNYPWQQCPCHWNGQTLNPCHTVIGEAALRHCGFREITLGSQLYFPQWWEARNLTSPPPLSHRDPFSIRQESMVIPFDGSWNILLLFFSETSFISHRQVFHGCFGVHYYFPSCVLFSHFSVYPSPVSFFYAQLLWEMIAVSFLKY